MVYSYSINRLTLMLLLAALIFSIYDGAIFLVLKMHFIFLRNKTIENQCQNIYSIFIRNEKINESISSSHL